MRTYALGVTTLALLCSGCSSTMDGADQSDPISESASAITGSGTATLTVTSTWNTGFCADVNVTNTDVNPSNSWIVYVTMYSSTYTSGWEGTYAQGHGTLTIRPSANNGAIAAGGTANPKPGFCANRPAGTTLPKVSMVSTNYCGMAYRDADGDGYGAGSQVYTCSASGYVTRGGDCCDTDPFAFPGQTEYIDVPNQCGSFDYSCDGVVIKQNNGPTGCYEAPLTCRLSADRSKCIASGWTGGCNAAFTSYNTAACGETWYISSKGCTKVGSGSSAFCTAWFTGGPGGTQQCN